MQKRVVWTRPFDFHPPDKHETQRSPGLEGAYAH